MTATRARTRKPTRRPTSCSTRQRARLRLVYSPPRQRVTVALGYSSSEDNEEPYTAPTRDNPADTFTASQLQAARDKAEIELIATACNVRTIRLQDDLLATGCASKAEMYGCANNTQRFNLVSPNRSVSLTRCAQTLSTSSARQLPPRRLVWLQFYFSFFKGGTRPPSEPLCVSTPGKARPWTYNAALPLVVCRELWAHTPK